MDSATTLRSVEWTVPPQCTVWSGECHLSAQCGVESATSVRSVEWTVPTQCIVWSGQCHLSARRSTWKLEPVSCDVVKKESARGKVTGAFIGTVCTRQKLLFGKAVTVCMTLGCTLLAPRCPPKVASTVTKLTMRCSVCSNKMLVTSRGTLC